MEKIIFDPKKALKDQGRPILTNRLEGRPPWVDVWKNWWGGATIGRPTLSAALEAKKILDKVRFLVNQNSEEVLMELNKLYLEETQLCRRAINRILQIDEKKTDIVFETSGTSAISLVRHSIEFEANDNIITSDENGNLVFPTLIGKDPYRTATSAFVENVRLFTEHRSHIPDNLPPVSLKKVNQIGSDKQWKTNERLIEEILNSIDSDTRLIVLPQVTNTGRILPVEEIGASIKILNESRDKKITYVIDGVQALGRTDSESVDNPLDYCDYYVCTSSKALGGILIASAIIAKKLTWNVSVPVLLDSNYSEHLRFYQFMPESFPSIYENLVQRPNQQAISLPEIASFRKALEGFYLNGEGKTYSDRRNHSLSKILSDRLKVIDQLARNKDINILDGDTLRPVVPSIISFTLTHPELNARQIKDLLQSDPGPVILSANVGNIMRLSLAEYYKMPNPTILSEKLERILT